MLIGSPSSAPAGATGAISGVSSSLRTKSVRSRRAGDDRTSRRDGFLNEEFDKGLPHSWRSKSAQRTLA